MTDNWDSEEGYLNQGGIIGYVTLTTSVVAGDSVTWAAASVQNQVAMRKYTAATGYDSVGVAMKGGVTGDKIPVCMWGVVKMVSYATITQGDVVGNAGTAGTTITYGNVQPMAVISTWTLAQTLRGINNTGTINRMGTALQSATTVGDTLLVLVGRYP